MTYSDSVLSNRGNFKLATVDTFVFGSIRFVGADARPLPNRATVGLIALSVDRDTAAEQVPAHREATQGFLEQMGKGIPL